MSEHRTKSSSQSEAPPPMPEASFQYIVQMFGVQALIWTGHIPNPGDEKAEPNLDLAQFQIGLLEVVEQKTKGNLDKDEEEYLGAMLHNARMAFIGAKDRLAHEAENAPEAADAEEKGEAAEEEGEAAEESKDEAAEESKDESGSEATPDATEPDQEDNTESEPSE